MPTCFLITSQVVVIKTGLKKRKQTWAEFHLMTVWVMKINSRRIQAQPALILCAKMEEGWGASTWDSGVGWGKEARCELSLFQFPGERHWVIISRANKLVLEHSLLIFFTLFPLVALLPSKLFHVALFYQAAHWRIAQGLSNRECWSLGTTSIYHVQQEVSMEDCSKCMTDSSTKSPEPSGIKI